MNIDLSLLHSKTINEISISGTYDIPKEYIDDKMILAVDNVDVNGYIRTSNDGQDQIKCVIKGEMLLADSISLEPISYPYTIEYDDILEENCKKNENTLDIFLFLWENIVLEVPLQFTKVEDLSKFHGDGWKLISEEELDKNNNPFNDLLKDFKEE